MKKLVVSFISMIGILLGANADQTVTIPAEGGTASTTVSFSTGGTYQFKGGDLPSWITGFSLSVKSGSSTINLGRGSSSLSLVVGATATLKFTASVNTTGASRSCDYVISGPATTTVRVTQSGSQSVTKYPDLQFAKPGEWPAHAYFASVQWATTAKSSFGTSDACYLCYAYGNLGDADATRPETVIVELDGEQVDAVTPQGNLAVGKGRTISRPLPISGLKAGQHTVVITINPSKAIVESNYDNNTVTLTFNVTAAAQTYTVRFNRNDGSGETKTQTFTRGVSQNLLWKDSQLKWTRDGYTFLGWAKSSTGAVVYSNGQSVKDIAAAGATLNLYAVWQAPSGPTPSAVALPAAGGTASTTVSFPTGGTYQFKGGDLPAWITGFSLSVKSGSSTFNLGRGTSSLSLVAGATATLKFTASANATGASRSCDYVISGPATTTVRVTQPAQSASTYTVRFNKNDGSGETETRTYTVGASLSLPWINSGLGWTTPSGWSIVGWAKSASATSAAYANGASVSALGTAGQTVDLYVVWKKMNPFGFPTQAQLAPSKYKDFVRPLLLRKSSPSLSYEPISSYVRGENPYVHFIFANFGSTSASIDKVTVEICDAARKVLATCNMTMAATLSASQCNDGSFMMEQAFSALPVGSYVLRITLNPAGGQPSSGWTNVATYSFTVTAATQPTQAYTAYLNKNAGSSATAAQHTNDEAAFTPGFYCGEFADGTGTFDLLIEEDGSAFFRAETEDGDWAAECVTERIGETLLLTFEAGEPVVIRLVNGSWVAE